MAETLTSTKLKKVNSMSLSPTTSIDGAKSPSTSGQAPDVEQSNVTNEREDPYQLRNALKSDAELAELRNRKKTGKRIEKYHKTQNELISNLLKPLEEHTSDAKEAEDAARLPVRIAVHASLIANFLICVLQLYAAIGSGSFAILAVGIDSVFDIGANVILSFFHRRAKKLDVNKWPVGGSRLETIGNITYGSLMAAVNVVVVVECVRDLVSSNHELKKFHLIPLLTVAVALGVKLVLFLYCFALRNADSQVEMLCEDHRNDVGIYSFAILTSAGGAKLAWWLDPLGGLLIALAIIVSWTRTLHGQFGLLAGKSAPHEFLQLVTYKAATFSDLIEKVDTVRAYHSGPNYFLEVDIIMAGDAPLWQVHDLSQQMQDRLEALPGVERAFVHVDHETTHTPEHRHAV